MIRKIAPPVYAIVADALYAEYATRGIEFPRALDDLPWNSHRWTRIKQESYPCLSAAK
ncbi:MAG TPA: hypothetical protein VKT81_13785 [Bryobacteraceae bacterium]|nr:hypothetical protein [Bryobacteraceae bacterium]